MYTRQDMDNKKAFYEEYVDKIYSFCYYRTANREEAEDITSEAFLRFYSSDGLNKPNPTAYLYVICRNLIIDHWRKHNKTVSFGQFSIDDAMFGREENKEQKLLIDQILESMKLLPEDQRDVLEMKYVHDLDNRTIAGATQKSEAAVKSLAHRGLDTLRKKYGTK